MKKCRKFRVPERKYLEVYKNQYVQEAVWGVVKNGYTHCRIGPTFPPSQLSSNSKGHSHISGSNYI